MSLWWIFSAAHPEQAFEIDAGCGSRMWIEGIAGVDDDAVFSPAGCGGEGS